MTINQSIMVERMRQILELGVGNMDYFSPGKAVVTAGKSQEQIIKMFEDTQRKENGV